MKTILSSTTVVKRILLNALVKVGFDQLIAKSVVDTYMEYDKRLEYWNIWFHRNCMECKDTPVSCSFFNPPKVSGGTKEEMVEGNIHSIEKSWKSCPLVVPMDTKDNSNS